MTAQEPEIIFLEGKRLDLYAAPLESYFECIKSRPAFRYRSTAQLRGYTGRWEVFGSRLFLTGLLGMGWMEPPTEIDNGWPNPKLLESMRVIELKDIFPDQAPLVFAEWVTELVVVATGPSRGIRFAGYQADLASHLTIDIAKGHLHAIHAWVNGERVRKIPLDDLADEFRKTPPKLLSWPHRTDQRYLASVDEYVRGQEYALRKPCGRTSIE